MEVRVLLKGILEARSRPDFHTQPVAWMLYRVGVGNTEGQPVGLVRWRGRPRAYTLETFRGGGFSPVVSFTAVPLRLIADFLEELTVEVRKRKWGRERRKRGKGRG